MQCFQKASIFVLGMRSPHRHFLASIALLAASTASVGGASAGEPYTLAAAAPLNTIEQGQMLAGETCAGHTRSLHGAASLIERQQAMERELLAYQGLVEEALAMRARAIRLVHVLREKVDRHEPLSGHDLQRLNQGATELLDQRAALFRASVAHECWLDEPVPADPAAARLQQTGIAMSLSAALVLYDNYLSAISLYRNDSKLRKHLNQSDSGYAIREGELNRLASSFASPANRHRVRRGLEWFAKHGAATEAKRDNGYRYLTQLIEQSPSQQIVRQARPIGFLGNMLNLFGTVTFDTLSGLKDEGVNFTSLLFGNAVGLVESRRGKLDARPDVLGKVSSTIKAGDILLEKTPFRLTDAFIPGHWGHVAVWVGNEAELRSLGIWDHPAVRLHQENIRAGRGVVEALRAGVEMNPLARFLNVDDLAVLRQTEIDDKTRTEVIVQALRQVGKAYDFNFDVESTNRIVCSELVYHAYAHLEWPTVRRLGRATISPDNVAVRAIDAGPLNVAVLYHDGDEIADSQRLALAKLVQREVVELASR
jgi:uncharacterized protein YycO